MKQPSSIDGVLVEWGDRLFYPDNRIVRPGQQPKLGRKSVSDRAAAIRQRIIRTVVRRSPQVMVKVTGGGRGMKAIAAHFNYISKHGKLELEDDQGNRLVGKEALRDVVDEWRFGGTYIENHSDRREAFNIMLSMPRGTNPQAVHQAAREFARAELSDHRYVMVLHDHQANPHVHLSVRAESRHGKRLNPRKANLHRWRETFAEKLRGLRIDAEATRQPTRGLAKTCEPLWRYKARQEGRVRVERNAASSARLVGRQDQAMRAWGRIAAALSTGDTEADSRLALSIVEYFSGHDGKTRPEMGALTDRMPLGR
jgi:hypothetical protein